MKLATKRLDIRNIEAIDFDDLFEYMSNEEVMKYESNSFTKESLEKFMEEIIPSKRFFALILKTTNKLIGHIYVGKTNPERFNEYNVGYILNPKYHRQGYCSEATKVLCKYAFDVLKANRLTAKCNPENIASWKVMEKVGFKKEGLLRKRVALRNDRFGNPIFTDELIYGMLKEDLE